MHKSISGLSPLAYLDPHFENDVFVSYSQGDPSGTGGAPLKRWTEALIEQLRADIQSVDTEFDRLHFWIDAQLDPTAPLTSELRDKVKSSAILMVIMSPRYLQSRWCKDELEWFREQVRERSNDQGRVFVVRVLPTKNADWPDFLRDDGGNSLVGFQFHDSITKKPFGWRDVNDNDYVRQLWTLQTALTKRLRQLRERYESRPKVEVAPTAQVAALFASPPVPQADASNGPRRIYVHARGDQLPARNEVQRQLSRISIIALSAAADPGITLDAWTREAKARFETAKRCDALALVRADASEGFIGDLLEIGVDERERIRSARGSALPCAVLDLSGAPLPIDVSPFGIRRFDLGQENWPNEFGTWLDESRRPRPGGQ